MTIALTLILAAAALGAAFAARRRRAEALTILLVALPIVLWVPSNGSSWLDQLRHDRHRSEAAALAVAPPTVVKARNLPYARRAKAVIGQDQTFAIVPAGRWTGAGADKAALTYLSSWYQYWLAPRIQVDPAKADWLLVLDGAGDPPPPGATSVYRVGNDLLVGR